MKYDFCKDENSKKKLTSLVENMLFYILLFYVGYNGSVNIVGNVLNIYIWITFIVYIIAGAIFLFIGKENYILTIKNQKVSSPSERMFNGIFFGVFITFMVLSIIGKIPCNRKLIVFLLIVRFITPVLIVILSEIKSRFMGFSCSDEVFLLYNDTGDNKILNEYREARESILLSTNLEENPKVFRTLAHQYRDKLNGN